MIEEIFHGCVCVKKIDEQYYPQRFTDAQLEIFSQMDKRFQVRSKCTAGVTLEFSTDCAEISFCYQIYDYCRPQINFDIFENEILTKHILCNEKESIGKIIYKRKQIETSTIKIYLPWAAVISLSNFKLGNWAPTQKNNETYLFLGDSITQGMNVDYPSQTWSALIATIMQADMLNQGVGGVCFNTSFLDTNLPCSPSKIFVAYGTNDIKQVADITIFEKNIDCYFKSLITKFNTEVIVITPIQRFYDNNEVGLNAKHQKFVQCITNYATKYSTTVVQGSNLVPHLQEFYEDFTTHPNLAGSHLYAFNILKALKIMKG